MACPPPERPFSPPIGTQAFNIARSDSRSSLSPLRHRSIQRSQTFADGYPPLRQRRSSTFSDSAASIKSSTDDLLLPRAKSPDEVHKHEESHWHSVPLALALVPAIGGLLFENGGTILTDLTLLGLAAVFLNWSVRLPWGWYHAAQQVVVAEPDFEEIYRNANPINEEGSEAGTSQPSTPGPEDKQSHTPLQEPLPHASGAYHSAAGELRIHELTALLACFISPMVGAWLLHHIRAQLSRPSEGLVSNYNLTIFLLAAELRPVSHFIKLIQARTLHLQRVVANNPHESPAGGVGNSLVTPERVNDLIQRVAELEAQNPTTAGAQAKSPQLVQQQHQELVTATRKTLQPDVDALNRAVRRYEKRVTLLTMQTESRLQDLEGKMADAITLAAAAERKSSGASSPSHSSSIMTLLDWTGKAILLPMQVAFSILLLPGRLLASSLEFVEGFMKAVMLGATADARRSSMERGSRSSNGNNSHNHINGRAANGAATQSSAANAAAAAAAYERKRAAAKSMKKPG